MSEILETTNRPGVPEVVTRVSLGMLRGPAPKVTDIPDDLHELVPEQPRRLHQFFERQADKTPFAVALETEAERLTYAELDARANRLARYLASRGTGPGKTAGILLERSAFTYVALLAVLKSGAAFVPIDPSYPADRVAFIASDAALSLLLTSSKLAAVHGGAPCPVVALDSVEAEVASLSPERLSVPDEEDDLAYIIYTSGTTGRPKGVAVNHANICHFLSVVAPIYGVGSTDRVYQGMTIAFDFSIEEIWPTWVAGATLVAGPVDSRRIGSGLAEFLNDRQITMLYCVPTLLATLDREIPSIHTLVVGGEACPRDLVDRWSRPGRRMLNTYGPTETTVTATWCELEPGRPVTIGRPLPGYRVYVLDENLQPVAPGESGEICIGGAGVARGYVNRPELTDAKFVADPFEPRLNARMYRSGDLGRFAPNGEVEFLGRIDSQVKIRGYRIELGEIEAVLLEDGAVENAIVAAVPFNGPAQDLAAYITVRGEVDLEQLKERLAGELRRRVPAYMVPAYIEVLDSIPMLASGKADRKSLPEPKSGRLSVRPGEYVAPATKLEERLSRAWRTVFGQDEISVTADFFTDLGGHSLFAAQLISRLRNEAEFRHLSVADLYGNPTIRTLAGHIEASAAPAAETRPVEQTPRLRHTSARVWRAGLTQFGMLYALLAFLSAPAAFLLAEHAHQHSALGITMWDAVLPSILLVVALVLPVALKWTLIGRFRAGRYPLWGSYYCRWWLVRKAQELSPMYFLSGSPLMSVYARLLGARIGRGVHIATAQVHLPDLIAIGDGAHIGYEVELSPSYVEDGWLHIAPICIGAGAFLGTKSVVMAGAEIGEGARIAEQTLVTRNQSIPASESWSGSPARQVATRDDLLDSMEAKKARLSTPAWLWAGFIGAFAALEILPLAIALPGLLLIAYADEFGGPAWALAATIPAGLLFVLTALLAIAIGKRVVMPHARPGIYELNSWFGLRKWIADKLMATSLALTNTLYATLYTLPWLRALGARIGKWSEVSTVSHIDPDLLVLGNGTFVADIATVGAATFHSGCIALDRTVVGDRTFLGNASVLRSHMQIPDNCLIGVQSVAPVEAPKPGTSWLGSPAIFLPKRQVVDSFDEGLTYRPLRSLVAYRLFVEFFRIVLPLSLLYLMAALVTLSGWRLVHHVGAMALAAVMPALYFGAALAAVLSIAGLKWLIVGRYKPRVEPLWAPFVRHSELITGMYESVAVPVLVNLLTGTPLIAPVLRLFGVRIGKRVYLGTTYMTEFDLVEISDDAAVGRAASLQTHLFEDRVMKMSTLHVGEGAAVGTRAVVLYDSEVGENAKLDSLSLAMKGESIPAGTNWRGIPSRLVA